MESVKEKEVMKILESSKKSHLFFIIGLVLLLLGSWTDKTEGSILSITACILFLIAIIMNLRNLEIEKIFKEE